VNGYGQDGILRALIDAEIFHTAPELMVAGKGATTELLANRFGVDASMMWQRLSEIESAGLLCPCRDGSTVPV
jgi:hypothetical protein